MSVLTGPPEIDGYEFLEPLGSGGFADVYLYEQQMPRRTVAVKVLRGEDVGDQAVTAFLDEANVMAQLSAHPSIVTVYSAGVLHEDGRPYIVMEHCPRGNLGTRFRTEPFSVAEALAIGVQLAGAVETAHRAGVLHRDIKPENVLITSLNRPALTDFGIAARLGSAVPGAAPGMSVPWSAPEVIEGSWSGPATDVYSLGATVYSLLAGRSPFESPTGPNELTDYALRILQDDLPPIGRPDVPESLEQALATAMSRSPQARQTSALSFARSLQKVQRELGLEVTDVDVLDNGFSALASPVGAGLPLRTPDPDTGAAPMPDASLPTVAAVLPEVLANLPDPPGNLADPPALALAMSAAASPAVGEGAPPDIALVMEPGDAASLAVDATPSRPAESLAVELMPASAAESWGFDAPPTAVEPLGLDAAPPGAPEPLGPAEPPTAVESLGLAPSGADEALERRPVWATVLVDLVLIGAVAGAGYVYLLLTR